MQRFMDLRSALEAESSGARQGQLLRDYFATASPADAAWAVALLLEGRGKRVIKRASLRRWAADAADLPLWMIDECEAMVGDLAETLALLVPSEPPPRGASSSPDNSRDSEELPFTAPDPELSWTRPLSLTTLMEALLTPLTLQHERQQRPAIVRAWSLLDTQERVFWNRLLLGGLRPSVSTPVLTSVLASQATLPASVVALRLRSLPPPDADWFRCLLRPEQPDEGVARVYPFGGVAALTMTLDELGPVSDWHCEWLRDTPRVQLIHRAGRTLLWSDHLEFLPEDLPELLAAAAQLPDGTVLEGQLDFPRPQAGATHQTAGHKTRGRPAFVVADLLEWEGRDCRSLPLRERRRMLESALSDLGSAPSQVLQSNGPVQGELFGTPAVSAGEGVVGVAGQPATVWLQLSPLVPLSDWSAAARAWERARIHGARGIILKHLDAPHAADPAVSRQYCWPVPPHRLLTVLLGLERGAMASGVGWNCTLGVWRDTKLVPVAKVPALPGKAEQDFLDDFLRTHAQGRFGPVRGVTPRLVFELAFDDLEPSPRHKCGFVLHAPRIVARHPDLSPAEAATTGTLKAFSSAGVVRT